VHEFAIVQSLCEAALEEAKRHSAVGILSITCRVGVMRQIVPEIMQTAFELTSEGTLLEKAILKLETDGVESTCSDCGARETVYELLFECPVCGSTSIRCSGGKDITLVSMDISQGEGDGDSSS